MNKNPGLFTAHPNPVTIFSKFAPENQWFSKLEDEISFWDGNFWRASAGDYASQLYGVHNKAMDPWIPINQPV